MRYCLIIKTSSFGDIFQTLPEVLKLKKQYPECLITWVVEKKCASILQGIRQIDQILMVDFKAWRARPFHSRKEIALFFKQLREVCYDLVLDFQANTKSALILAFAKALEKRSFAKNQVSECLHKLLKLKRVVVKTDHYSSLYGDLIEDLVGSEEADLPDLKEQRQVEVPHNQMVIMLALGSMWPSKEFDSEQIKALIKNLNTCYSPYFLIPALKDQTAHYTHYLEGYQGRVITEKNLLDYVPYLKKTDLFLGVDSALLHLARLFKVPSRGYFGPSSALFYGTKGDVQGPCPYNQSFIKRCSYLRTCKGPCLKNMNLSDEI